MDTLDTTPDNVRPTEQDWTQADDAALAAAAAAGIPSAVAELERRIREEAPDAPTA